MRGYGRLVVICGPMFSGKSSLLIEEIVSSDVAPSGRLVLKPAFDTRDAPNVLASRGVLSVPAQSISSWPVIPPEIEVLYLDEVQFFDQRNLHSSFGGDLPSEVARCLRRGVNVVAAGLDLAYDGTPFHVTSTLLGMADEVVKLTARCDFCGAVASKTVRAARTQKAGLVCFQVGDDDLYRAACNGCFVSHLQAEVAGSGAVEPSLEGIVANA